MTSKFFNPKSSESQRAVQAWQILVGKAMNRQTTTYLDLSRDMYGKDAAGVLSDILGHIAFYCKALEVPQLNVIVVGKGRGTPGDSIPLESVESRDEIREQVFAYDWYNLYPPSEAELAEAYKRRRL